MKAKKTPAASAATKEEPSFEQAIARLEAIVADMEAAELPLDEVLQHYEEGTRLVRFCGRKLEEAEKKIAVLAKQADGTVALTPFTAAPDQPAAAADEDEDAEAKLF